MNRFLLCMCTAMILSMLAVAQTTPSTDNNSAAGQGSTSPSMGSQQGAATEDATRSTTGATATSQGSMSSDSAATKTSDNSNMTMKGEQGSKKLKGCIQSQGGMYMLQTKHGKDVMLSGQDVSAHVGHEVTLHGMWSGGGMSGMSGTSGTASSSGKSFNVTSVDMISETCSIGKGSKSGMSGSSSSTGTPATPPQ
jgi:hypothetical protein